MPTRSRAVLVVVPLILLAGLAGAHWLMTNLAHPTYQRTCDQTTSGGTLTLVHGFGGDGDPTVIRACSAGAEFPVTARLDDARGELVLESRSRGLLAFDGKRTTRQVRVVANTVDHADDTAWIRLLDIATPFADRDLTQPYSGTSETVIPVEVGMPHTEQLPGGDSRARIEIGSHAEDTSLSVFLVARSSASR